MNDFLGVFPEALASFSLWLDGRTPLPWSLWMALFFPLGVSAIRIWIWVMRGMFWPTLCSYPKTKGGFCKRPTPGEWHRCWYHRKRRWRLTDRHRVNPNAERGRARDKAGLRLAGAGFLSPTKSMETILYSEGGFVRRPLGAIEYLFKSWPSVWSGRLSRLIQDVRSFKTTDVLSTQELPEHQGVSDQALVASDVVRSVVIALGIGVMFGILSVPLSDDSQALVQYMSTLAFVFMWACLRFGLWLARPNWYYLALRQTLPWFFSFLLAGIIGGLIAGTAGSA